jgi:hypothetical protein
MGNFYLQVKFQSFDQSRFKLSKRTQRFDDESTRMPYNRLKDLTRPARGPHEKYAAVNILKAWIGFPLT